MACFVQFRLCVRNIIYKEFKRYAGHSKWQNIRHIKKEMDTKKSSLAQQIVQRMTKAVRDHNSCDPLVNSELARIIAEAKKRSVPAATITNALRKLQDAWTGTRPVVSMSKGPSNIVLVMLLLNEIVLPKVNFLLRTAGFSICEEPNNEIIAKTKSIITTISCREDDQIIEDAIKAGAEDAEKLEKDNKQFIQFTCCPDELLLVENQLEKLNYEIIQSKIEYVPYEFITLQEKDLEIYNNVCEILTKSNLIIKFSSNVR